MIIALVSLLLMTADPPPQTTAKVLWEYKTGG